MQKRVLFAAALCAAASTVAQDSTPILEAQEQLPASIRRLTGEDTQRIEADRAKPAVEPVLGEEPSEAPSSVSGLDLVLAEASKPGDDLVSVVLQLWDADPTAEAMNADVGKEDRRILRAMYKEERAVAKAEAVAAIEAIGARNVSAFPISSQVSADVPRQRLLEALSLPAVVDASLTSFTVANAAAYDGAQTRDGILATALLDSGWDGNTGSVASETVPIGIAQIELDFLATDTTPNPDIDIHNVITNNPGFKDSSSGPSRVLSKWLCSTTSCATGVSPTPPAAYQFIASAGHATWVAGIIMGDLQQGQDSTVTTTAERIKRSGIAREAELIYLAGDSTTAWARALEQASDLDIDFANISAVDLANGSVCNPSYNSGGLNTTIPLVTNLGMLVVSAIGDEGFRGSSCNLRYPSTRPQVLSVGGLHTVGAFSAPSYSSTVLLEQGPNLNTNRGPLSITTVGGHASTASGIGVVAPGARDYVIQMPSGYTDTTTIFGTSFAAPAVTGAAAIWKDSFVELGNTSSFFPTLSHNPRIIKANMLAMADGINSSYSPTASGVSDYTGAGRLKVDVTGSTRQRNSSGSGFFWTMGVQTLTTSNLGTAVVVALPTAPATATWFKGALFWEETNFGATADITWELFDTCQPGTFSDIRIGHDTSYDLEKRMRVALNGGECLELRFNTIEMPTGSNRKVYWAAYYHSGSSP
jgi:hypothetical protein